MFTINYVNIHLFSYKLWTSIESIISDYFLFFTLTLQWTVSRISIRCIFSFQYCHRNDETRLPDRYKYGADRPRKRVKLSTNAGYIFELLRSGKNVKYSLSTSTAVGIGHK